MRFLVMDDEGEPLRRFWTRQEAEAFCLEGWTIRTDPKPPPRPKHWAFLNALNAVGEAPF